MTPAHRAAALLLAAAFIAPAAARAQTQKWPSERPPGPLATPQVSFPPYQLRTLANGLQVVVVPHHEQPAVSIRMLVGGGAAQDPGDKPGVAHFVTSLLDQGTASRDARQVADAVDAIGGQLLIGAGTDLTFAYITVLNDSFVPGLELLAEIVRTPVFAFEEVERQRQQLRSALKVSYQDPDYLASVVFQRLVYGQHPYGSPGLGTPESIERITRDDLARFHAAHFAPNNCILAVVGDVRPDEAFAAVERVLGAWPMRAVPKMLMLPAPAPERRVVVLDMPDAVQTEIRAGHLSLRRNSDDYLTLDLAVRILGGEGANRLQQVLRMQRGLTYSASADLRSLRLTGDIVAKTGTQIASTGEALRVMVDEFSRLRREMVGDRELDDAKAYVAGGFPLAIETPDAIATRLLTVLFYGLRLKELQSFRQMVNAVDPFDIERVTLAYLKPDRLTIVLAGPAAGILDQLRRVGFRNVEVVPLHQLDLTSPSLRRRFGARGGARPGPRAETTGGGSEAARAIVMKAVEASGGLEALQRVKTMKVTADTVMATPGGPLKAATTTYIEYPSRMRVDARMPQGEMAQASADGAAWIQDQNGARGAPDAIASEMALGLRRDWIALLAAAGAGALTGRQLTDERGLADRVLEVVELRAEGLAPVRLSIDAESGRLVALSYGVPGPGGEERVTESFEDFRAVAGLQIPFRAVVRRGTTLLFERVITDVQVNVPIDPALFQKPR